MFLIARNDEYYCSDYCPYIIDGSDYQNVEETEDGEVKCVLDSGGCGR